MHLIVESLEVSNFLSFFRGYKVHLKPFTVIMCNYFEGKNDLLRALEFVFGATVAENPINLVHKALREEFLVNREVQSYVKVTVHLVDKQKRLSFKRCIKNGKVVRIEHAISGIITPKYLYDEELKSLNLSIKKKNLIFYKSDFGNCIWGTSDDLERTINNCLRTEYLLEDWRKAKKEVKYLSEMTKRKTERNFRSIEKSHFVVAKLAKNFEDILVERESIMEESKKNMVDSSDEEDTEEMEVDSFEEQQQQQPTSEEINMNEIVVLESECDSLTNRIRNLKMKEATLKANLHYQEMKLAIQTSNPEILRIRINELNKEYNEKSNKIKEIWKSIHKTRLDTTILSKKMSYNLLCWNDKQTATYLQNRFTSYGRFIDYLKPSPYVELLKQIIGNEIVYANLCDSFESASNSINFIKALKYEYREMFIIFQHYPHKLKDLLTASGENGIDINTLEDLLIFLNKLCHYGLIDEVPVIIKSNIDYSGARLPEDSYVIYEADNLHFMSDGLIKCKRGEETFCIESEEELQDSYVKIKIEEETKYQELNNLIFLRYEILCSMNHLKNDIFYFGRALQKLAHMKVPLTRYSSPLHEIYHEYSNIFSEFEENCRNKDLEHSPGEEQHFSQHEIPIETTFLAEPTYEHIRPISEDLKNLLRNKNNLEKLLERGNAELRSITPTPMDTFRIKKYRIGFHNLEKSKLFYDKELKKLKSLIAKDDLEDFIGSQEWRKSFIEILMRDVSKIREKLKRSNDTFISITHERNVQLQPLIQHCSQHLTSTFRCILETALPYIELKLTPEENIILASSFQEYCRSKNSIVEIKHFNGFLKFVTVLSMFLELAVFDQIPLMILEEIDEFFPLGNGDLEDLFNDTIIEKLLHSNINPHFQLLMRVGQFFSYYIKKNTPHKNVRKTSNANGYKSGPTQMIYFSTGHLIHAAEHFIWIHSQALPEEYTSDDCNRYSEIHELHL